MANRKAELQVINAFAPCSRTDRIDTFVTITTPEGVREASPSTALRVRKIV
ncbi:hypothetical protein [Acidisarcina polymorpha]|nr:hypothetical protein [Acidisarcina polymorpha]